MKTLIFLVFILISSQFLSADNWEIQLILENNGTIDNSNWFGVDEDASNGYDLEDIPELPFMDCSLYFPHNDWGVYSDNYTKDIRNDTIEHKAWDIEIMWDNPAPVFHLSWQDVDFGDSLSVPAYYQILLHHNGNEINMRDTLQYSFTSNLNMMIELIPDIAPPSAVEELNISTFDDSVQINWQPVTTDVNGDPINDVYYDIYADFLPDFTISPANFVQTTNDTFAVFPTTSYPKRFFKIVAVVD